MKCRARLASFIALALVVVLFPATGHAQTRAEVDKAIENNIGDPVKFQSVMTSLQQAVAKHNAPAVAALVSYPIAINPRTNKAMRVRTPQGFVASYDKIITPHIADVIAKQKYEELFVNYQGAMFGTGEIWIAGICKDKECKQSDIKIKTIQNTAGKSK